MTARGGGGSGPACGSVSKPGEPGATAGDRAAMSRHIFPFTADAEDRELLASLFAAYPDFHDVALALIEDYSCGVLSFEVVDQAFRANGWEWPGL